MKKKLKKIIVIAVFIMSFFMCSFTNKAFAQNNQQENQLILLNVVKTWTSINECSWERHVLIKNAPGYQVYEAAIWNDSVRLYKFDESFDSFKLNEEYRESFLVAKYDIPGGRDSENASKYIAEAFKDIFRIMVEKSPSKYYGIKTTGHGSGDGYMFTSCIAPDDAQDLMKYITKLLGRKVDFYDMSTNCNQGTVEMMNEFYPYFDYILSSELSVGGYSMDPENKSKFMEVFDFYKYPYIFNQNKSLEDKLKDLVDLRRKDWEYSRKNMIQNEKKESLSLFNMNNYEILMKTLRQDIKNKRIDPNMDKDSLKDLIYEMEDSNLVKLFNSFVVYRKTNEDFFWWNKDFGPLYMRNLSNVMNFDKKHVNTSDDNDTGNNDTGNTSRRSWQLESVVIESDHDYSNNSYDLKKYTKANAKYVALYIPKIKTERDVDYIYILDKDKKVVQKYTGDLTNQRVIIPGDTAYVYLVTNEYNTDYGYKIDYAGFME